MYDIYVYTITCVYNKYTYLYTHRLQIAPVQNVAVKF